MISVRDGSLKCTLKKLNKSSKEIKGVLPLSSFLKFDEGRGAMLIEGPSCNLKRRLNWEKGKHFKVLGGKR